MISLDLSKVLPAITAFGLAACNGAGDETEGKVAEQFRKQFTAQCSLEYMNTGITPEQKTAVCDCATEELLAKMDLPSGEELTQVSVTMDDIMPALQTCEPKVGIEVMTKQQETAPE